MREFIVPLAVEHSPLVQCDVPLKAPTTAMYFSHPEMLTESLLGTLHNSTGMAQTWLSQNGQLRRKPDSELTVLQKGDRMCTALSCAKDKGLYNWGLVRTQFKTLKLNCRRKTLF